MFVRQWMNKCYYMAVDVYTYDLLIRNSIIIIILLTLEYQYYSIRWEQHDWYD